MLIVAGFFLYRAATKTEQGGDVDAAGTSSSLEVKLQQVLKKT